MLQTFFEKESFRICLIFFVRYCIQKTFGNLDVIFQDDQDGKQRTQFAINAVNVFFEKWIEPEDGYAKLVEVWPIKNIWGVLKKKTKGKNLKHIFL